MFNWLNPSSPRLLFDKNKHFKNYQLLSIIFSTPAEVKLHYDKSSVLINGQLKSNRYEAPSSRIGLPPKNKLLNFCHEDYWSFFTYLAYSWFEPKYQKKNISLASTILEFWSRLMLRLNQPISCIDLKIIIECCSSFLILNIEALETYLNSSILNSWCEPQKIK